MIPDLTLLQYTDLEEPTLEVPITRDDALDLARETARADNAEATVFYLRMMGDR